MDSQHPDPASVLVIRRDNIGDLVCTTPLLTALRVAYPSARIGVLVNSYNAPVLDGNPDVDDVYVYTKLKHVGANGGAVSALVDRISLIMKLRRMNLDAVMIPAGPQDTRSLKFSRFLSPRRIVVSDPAKSGEHEVERAYSAAFKFGIKGQPSSLRVFASTSASERVRTRLDATGHDRNTPLIGLHISARRNTQRWPATRFADLCIAMHEEHGSTALLLWSPGDSNHPQHPGDDAKAETIKSIVGAKVPLLAWPTPALPDLVAGLAQCDTVVCSDGGAMHLAAGLGRPVVCFFGDSPPERWHPWGVRYKLLRPSSRRVEDISVATASSAVTSLLRSKSAD